MNPLIIFLLLMPVIYAENPRDHIIRDPENPRFGYKGVILKGGAAYSHAIRLGKGLSADGRGISTGLWGGNIEAGYDITDRKGVKHLIPCVGMNFFPFQGAYVKRRPVWRLEYAYADTVVVCHHYHFYGAAYVGKASRYRKGTRRYYATLGPMLNLLVWQRSYSINRLGWGAGLNSGVVVPGQTRLSLIAEIFYKFIYYHKYYWGEDLDVNTYLNTIGLSAGIIF